MTREELKEHCERRVKAYEMWASDKGEKPSGQAYEEHKLILEVLEQEPRAGWIPVNEKIPIIETDVLLTSWNSKVVYVGWIDDFGKWHADEEEVLDGYEPLAWMPLPEPYKESEEQERMTREEYEKAKKIVADIQSLKNIKKEYEHGHWISFYGAAVDEQPISDGILREDLKKFIDDEIEKLERELEQI